MYPSLSHQPQHLGVENTRFVSRLCALHPPLAPLVVVLKQLLHEKGLNDPFKGGLGAYGLTVMAAAVCQRYALQPPPEKPSIGMLFVNFLETYGTRGLDTRRSCISLAPSGPLLPLSLHHFNTPRVGSAGFWQPAPPVVIVDPLHPALNVASSCFGFRQVQICFDNALNTLLHCSMEKCSNYNSSSTLTSHLNASVTTNLDQQNTNSSQTSILGAVFGASHHKQVVNLSASIWCPLENASSLSYQNNNSTTVNKMTVNTSTPSQTSSPSSITTITPLQQTSSNSVRENNFTSFSTKKKENNDNNSDREKDLVVSDNIRNTSSSIKTNSFSLERKTNQELHNEVKKEETHKEEEDDDGDDRRQMPSSFVSSLSVAELDELTSLLGRATPLSNIETLRVQSLMKQTTPNNLPPLPPSPLSSPLDSSSKHVNNSTSPQMLPQHNMIDFHSKSSSGNNSSTLLSQNKTSDINKTTRQTLLNDRSSSDSNGKEFANLTDHEIRIKLMEKVKQVESREDLISLAKKLLL